MSDSHTKKVSLNNKLNLILKNQEKIILNERKILGEEAKFEEIEKQELKKDDEFSKSEEETLEELANLEDELKHNMTNPLKKVTKRDLFKGFIGAFIGVMSHFAFSKAADIAPTLSVWRATFLYFAAFMIIVIMLYYTGFRTIEKKIVLKFMPLRAMTLYLVSILAILVVNFTFNKVHFPLHFDELYVLVGTSIILAVMGAGTADLIGRNEE